MTSGVSGAWRSARSKRADTDGAEVVTEVAIAAEGGAGGAAAGVVAIMAEATTLSGVATPTAIDAVDISTRKTKRI